MRQVQPSHRFDDSFGVRRAVRVAKLGWRIGLFAATGRKAKASEELVSGMYALGGVYVKFLQIITNLMPNFAGMTDSVRSSVYDATPYQEINIYEILEKQLGSQSKLIRDVSPKVLATGSFAQVYEATHVDGTKVILKVLRPHVKRQLKTDLRLLGIIAIAAQPLVPQGVVSLRNVYKDYRKTALQEVDYRTELENALLMAETYKDINSIVIPRTYQDLCTNSLIVQEKIEGLALSDLLKDGGNPEQLKQLVLSHTGSDVVHQMGELGFALISTALSKEFTYGDPHPGNIILMTGNRVGLIDFGAILPRFIDPHAAYSVLEDHRRAHEEVFDVDIANHVVNIFSWYNPRTFRALRRIDSELTTVNIVEEFTKLVKELIEPRVGLLEESMRSGKGMPTRLLMEVINGPSGSNKLGLVPHEPTARLARAHSQFWNITRQLDMTKGVGKRVSERLGEYFKLHPEELGPKPEAMTFAESTQIVNDWFTSLVERDPLLFGSLFAKIRKTLQNQERTNNA